MKKQMSLVTSKCITYVANGIGWLAYAFLSAFDNLVCSIFSSAILQTSVVLSMKGRRSTKEIDDEMSEYNLTKAKATTMEWLRMIICIIFLLLAAGGLLHEFFSVINETFNISLGLIVPLILGITEIMIGFLFVKYEKDGE